MNLESIKHVALAVEFECAEEKACCSRKKLDKFIAYHSPNFYKGSDGRIYVLAKTMDDDTFYMDAVTGGIYTMDGEHLTNYDRPAITFKKCTKSTAVSSLINQFKSGEEAVGNEL